MTGTPPHPQPPSDLKRLRLLVRKFRRAWYRIHRLQHHPAYFGKSGDNRFDAPTREFGVLYVGKDARCAFIETFGHATGVRIVEQIELETRGLARVEPHRPLRLVDLRGEDLARLGADARLTTGESYAVAQLWSRAIHDHPRQPDGIVYNARHDPSRVCAAIFERAHAALAVTKLGSLADPAHAALVARLLNTYEFGLI